MKILLFGKGGQVGWELQRSLLPLGDLIALDFDSTELCGSFADLDGIARTIRTVRPAVIVNAAAHTAVDRAEAEPALAHTLNADAPGVLAREADALGAWVVHYSTDYVFDGSGCAPWRETDRPAPLSVYGRTKLAGEGAVARASRHLILRTSWVYAARGGNFARTMLRLAAERDSLRVIDDQVGAPTSAELLADCTAHALRAALDRPALAGLYHVAAAGETSWHGYARHVIARAAARGQPLKAGPDNIVAIATAEYPTPARRPLNSRLDTCRFRQAFSLTLPDWRVQVDRMVDEICA
ncbi:MAG: dTDP-4-dehydrorhamnose reductase [Burkholderiales bacterium]|nr:dTDP-4-dehydrorhamnose reductase [Burkholderiales bacterium]